MRDPGLAVIRASTWTVKHRQRLLVAGHIGKRRVGALDAVFDGQPGLLFFAGAVGQLRIQWAALAFVDAQDNEHARQDNGEGGAADFYVHGQTLLEKAALYGNGAGDGRAP
ncbi:hypothetical protein D3C80_1878480 [compost metagenome]